jgi:hypothetical protein
MPTVNFIGEIDSAECESSTTLSVSYGVLPGSRAWTLRSGENAGESQAAEAGYSGVAQINHPLDIFYETSSAEGWPALCVEVYDRSEPGCKNFIGCGSCWMPMSPGDHVVDINLWKISASGLDALADYLLPNTPDLKALREIQVNPYLRSQYMTSSPGEVRVKVTVVVSKFDKFGVSL